MQKILPTLQRTKKRPKKPSVAVPLNVGLPLHEGSEHFTAPQGKFMMVRSGTFCDPFIENIFQTSYLVSLIISIIAFAASLKMAKI
jgi:hypothetical protein